MKTKLKVLGLLLLFAGNILAQDDPFEKHMFPPELVMQHQRAIALTSGQRDSLKKEIQEAQAKFTELQWDLENEMDDLEALLKQERVDEQRSQTVLGRVLQLESDIKQTHMRLAIRIKNLLNSDQQAKLREIKKEMARSMLDF